MKRIVFLDYVRVFACFLVMVVHASENFYGAAGSTDMVGPQSYLANEGRTNHMAILPSALHSYLAGIFHIYDTI